MSLKLTNHKSKCFRNLNFTLKLLFTKNTSIGALKVSNGDKWTNLVTLAYTCDYNLWQNSLMIAALVPDGSVGLKDDRAHDDVDVVEVSFERNDFIGDGIFAGANVKVQDVPAGRDVGHELTYDREADDPNVEEQAPEVILEPRIIF